MTSSPCVDRATSPRSSYTDDVATPADPGPSVVSASTHTQSPTGSRSRCTVISVFMNAHSAGSRAAETPEAESTQVISIAVPDSGSSGSSGTIGRIQTVAAPGLRTAPWIQRHSTWSMYPSLQDGGSPPTDPSAGECGSGVRVPGPEDVRGSTQARATAHGRPASTSCRVADSRETERPGRSTAEVTRSGPTGTGPRRSTEIRDRNCCGVRRPSRARVSSPDGGPPCCAVRLHGPAVAGVESTSSGASDWA